MIQNVYNVFIRKNTQELQNALKELGYESTWRLDSNVPCLVTHNGRMYSTSGHDFKTIHYSYKAMECFDNEELFLAAAAINNNCCFKDVYIKLLEDYQEIPAGTIIKNTTETIPQGMTCCILTFDELKEYFHVNVRRTESSSGEQQNAEENL